MARIAGVDLPPNKRVEIGLTYIFGIGRPRSGKILETAKVDRNTRVKDLSEDEVSRIRKTIQDQYEATFVDWELTGLANFTRNFGVTGGYRSRHVDYMLKKDTGDLKLSGLYIAAVLRY